MTPLIDPRIPRAIVRDALHPLGVVSAKAVPQGLSGAQIFRCEMPSGVQAALKCAAPGTKRRRLEEVQRVVFFAKGMGCRLVPTIYRVGDRSVWADGQSIWELLEWMPGVPLPAEPSSNRLEHVHRGAAAIADFHRSVRDLGSQRVPPPAVAARLKRIEVLDQRLPNAIRDAMHVPALAEASRTIQANWEGVRLKMIRSLGQYADQPTEIQYVLRDVHREHILFTDDNPTGLIDFDAVRMDTPITDLARWAGSLSWGETPESQDSLWEAAMAGFFSHSPFKNDSEQCSISQMARALAYATQWISLANWLVWIVLERREFPGGFATAATRIEELLHLSATASPPKC
ncbi:MAG: phosphotransferase enzyme family protein [Rubripirellula sp.]